MKLTLKASDGVQFDIDNPDTTNVATALTTSQIITTPGTYYLRIYGANQSLTGTWSLSASVQ